MVLLAQGDGNGAGGGLPGLVAGPGVGGEEEGGLGVVAELMAEDAEGARGIAEVVGGPGGGALGQATPIGQVIDNDAYIS